MGGLGLGRGLVGLPRERVAFRFGLARDLALDLELPSQFSNGGVGLVRGLAGPGFGRVSSLLALALDLAPQFVALGL